MLDAIQSITDARIDYDSFINLSDADISLRTNAEIVAFLRGYKGRQFIQVHTAAGEWLEKARKFTAAHAVVECGGFGKCSFFVQPCDTSYSPAVSKSDVSDLSCSGHVAINSSLIDVGGDQPVCCFGRGGPVVYANVRKKP